MSSLCLCVLFRPGLWPTNTGYCFVSVKRGAGAAYQAEREGTGQEGGGAPQTLRSERFKGAGHRSLPDDEKPGPGLPSAADSGLLACFSFWGSTRQRRLCTKVLFSCPAFFSSLCRAKASGADCQRSCLGTRLFQSGLPINQHKGNELWRRELASRSQEKNTVSTGGPRE